jgi:hypothetical protein
MSAVKGPCTSLSENAVKNQGEVFEIDNDLGNLPLIARSPCRDGCGVH